MTKRPRGCFYLQALHARSRRVGDGRDAGAQQRLYLQIAIVVPESGDVDPKPTIQEVAFDAGFIGPETFRAEVEVAWPIRGIIGAAALKALCNRPVEQNAGCDLVIDSEFWCPCTGFLRALADEREGRDVRSVGEGRERLDGEV